MASQPNQFRIIAGQWRGRRFAVPAHAAVRPSPERIRETLFNWLMHDIKQAVCLDAFAGSGALGLEALSRGAKQVYFIEQERTVVTLLRQHLQHVECQSATVLHDTMPAALSRITQKLDIVFLDPPFRQSLIIPTLEVLHNADYLHKHSLVYAETESEIELPQLLSTTWQVLKQSKAGQVKYYLLKYVVNK